jgi:hypothetical protein
MTEIEALVEEWRRSCSGDAWQGPSRALLRPVGVAAAATPPVPGAHSIREVVLNLTGWTGEALEQALLRFPPECLSEGVGSTRDAALGTGVR